jgi:hypothetical protein
VIAASAAGGASIPARSMNVSMTARKRSSKKPSARSRLAFRSPAKGHELALGAGQAPAERDPVGRVLAQIGVVATAPACEGGHRAEPAPRVGELVGRRQRHPVPCAGADQVNDPAEDVAPAVAPGEAAGRSNRHVHASAGLEELLGQL